jgi:predicted transcriptional regulator
MTDTTMTIPTDAELAAKVTAFSAAMDRSRNWVIEAVLRDYVATQA